MFSLRPQKNIESNSESMEKNEVFIGTNYDYSLV